jgi:hypothetical protein
MASSSAVRHAWHEEEPDMPDQANDDHRAADGAVQHDYAPVDTDLPGIDTATGSEQRFKVHVPSPDSLLTIGSVAKNDALGAPAGPGGFALRTVENLAAEIHKRTIIDTDEDTIIHTGKTLSGVAEELISLSSNGSYQLGVKKALEITADPGAGFSDPLLTIVPEMDVPDPPPVDTAGPRAPTESQKSTWDTVWAAWDFYDNGMALVEFAQKRKLASGLAKEVTATKLHKAYGLYKKTSGVYEAAKGMITAALNGGSAAVIAAGIKGDPKKKSGSKITIHALDGVDITTPSKISGYASGGVEFGSPKKVEMKGGLGAAITGGVGATVTGLVNAKLESKVFAVVDGGKLLTMKADLCELTASKVVHVSSKEMLALSSDDVLKLSAKTYLGVTAKDLLVGAESSVSVASDDAVEIRALKKSTLKGDENVDVVTEGGGQINLQIGDTKDHIEIKPDKITIKSKSETLLLVDGSYVGVTKKAVGVSSDEIYVKGKVIKLG